MLVYSIISRAIILPLYRVFGWGPLIIFGQPLLLILVYVVLSGRGFIPPLVLHYRTRYNGFLDITTLYPFIEYLIIYLALWIVLNSDFTAILVLNVAFNGP